MVTSAKVRLCRVGLRFSCIIEVDQAQMSLPMARDLIDTAGKRIGLLDFRPQRRGTFGRFNVAFWERAD